MTRPPVTDHPLKMKFGVDLPVDLLAALDRWCRQQGVRKNVVVERALRGYLADVGGG